MRSLMRSGRPGFPAKAGLAARALLAQASHRRSVTLPETAQAWFPHPQPLVTNCTRGGKVGGGPGRSGGGDRLLGPRAKTRGLWSCGPGETQRLFQPRARRGKGLLGVGVGSLLLQKSRREALSDPLRGEAPSRPSAHAPSRQGRVDACPQCWVWAGVGGWQVPVRKKCHPPPLLRPCHTPSPPCCPRGLSVRWLRMHTRGAAQDMEHRTRKERPQLSSGRSGPARGCSPPPRGTAGWFGGGKGCGGGAGKGGGTACQEHFQTHTARVPPKYR